MAELHHLIMYMCACLCTRLGFILHTRWVIFWQPWTFISRFYSAGKPCRILTLDFFEENRISRSSFL